MFTRNDVFEIFKFTQKINHPNAQENENFGRALAFDKFLNSVQKLVVQEILLLVVTRQVHY